MSSRCLFCERELSESEDYYQIPPNETYSCPECLQLVISTIARHTNIGSIIQPLRMESILDALKTSIGNWNSEKESAVFSIDSSAHPVEQFCKHDDEAFLFLHTSENTKTITVAGAIQEIAIQKLIAPSDLPANTNEEPLDYESYVKNMLFGELILKSRSIGAKACVQVDYIIDVLANGFILASASGTAVVLADASEE